MQRTLVTTILLAASWCSLSQGGTLSGEAVDTPGLPGFQTITLLFDAESGEEFKGFNAEFTGTINQVNPFGVLATIFTDNNVAFQAPSVPAQDSQFLFSSGDILQIGAEEGAGVLKGAISGLNQLGLPNPAAFAQIVTNRPCDVRFSIEFDNGRGGQSFVGSLGDLNCVPEPNSGTLVGLALAFAGRCRLRTSRH